MSISTVIRDEYERSYWEGKAALVNEPLVIYRSDVSGGDDPMDGLVQIVSPFEAACWMRKNKVKQGDLNYTLDGPAFVVQVGCALRHAFDWQFRARCLSEYTEKFGAPHSENETVFIEDKPKAAPKPKREKAAHINPYADLPKILAIIDVHDGGPCEGGMATATCPHCGADGRFVYTFLCEDGTTRGAMKGCLSKFPHHPFANEMERILGKERDYEKKGWNLPKWDVEIRDAILAFADRDISEMEAQTRVNRAKAQAAAYRNRRR